MANVGKYTSPMDPMGNIPCGYTSIIGRRALNMAMFSVYVCRAGVNQQQSHV